MQNDRVEEVLRFMRFRKDNGRETKPADIIAKFGDAEDVIHAAEIAYERFAAELESEAKELEAYKQGRSASRA